jgi:hypothetical protein
MVSPCVPSMVKIAFPVSLGALRAVGIPISTLSLAPSNRNAEDFSPSGGPSNSHDGLNTTSTTSRSRPQIAEGRLTV